MIDLQTKDSIIEVKNLIKKFPPNIMAVNNVSFSLNRGECIGLVGESGCGKSTLSNIITHMQKPTSGTVFFEGEDIFKYKKKEVKKYHRNIQMVFQNPKSVFSPKMTIGKFLCEGLINYKIMNKSDAKKEAINLLEQVELDSSYFMKFPHELSGGQLQRVVIARAISINPKVIIYDEPTSALDVSIQKNITKLLYDIQNKYNISTIFISHDLALVRLIADRILVMNDGEIIENLDSETFIKSIQSSITRELVDSVFTLEDKK